MRRAGVRACMRATALPPVACKMSFFGALFGGSMSFFKGSFNTEARRRGGAAHGRRAYPAAGFRG